MYALPELLSLMFVGVEITLQHAVPFISVILGMEEKKNIKINWRTLRNIIFVNK